MRTDKRKPDQLRNIDFKLDFIGSIETSVLASFGDTKVLCTATIEENVPRWMKNKGHGWVTAEYGMLPGSTNHRNMRESVKGKQTGRTIEIQRLIGRSLRAAVDLKALGQRTIILDCDVIQADGGTRTTAINGAFIALSRAVNSLTNDRKIDSAPIKKFLGAISVGIYKNEVIMDLNYNEDSQADTDMNIVMTEDSEFIEIQGTAENGSFSSDQLALMLNYAKKGIKEITLYQKKLLSSN
tara:strand:+ start:1500 stop:2219 length:720 start_codon:yes stop_codon:yes gene_type:complete